ncbi:MAG: DUF3667 domain-containing protein [Balneola sp.]
MINKKRITTWKLSEVLKSNNMTCKNCGEEISGDFCSYCGQKTKVDRINAQYILSEIPNTFFQIDTGLFFTIKEFFKRPGNSIREYLEGKRKNYIRPVSYVLLLSTFYALVANLISETTFLGEVVLGMAEGGPSTQSDPVLSTILQWIAQNHAYSTVLFLPFFSISSLIAFKKYRYNFFEHFVINAYITGQQAIIYSFFVLVQYIGSIDLYYYPIIPLSLSVGFAFWTFIQLFSPAGKISSFLRTLMAYILCYLIILAFLVIGIIAHLV